MNKVPLIKPTLMGKKTIFKTDTIPTKGSNNIVTSDALAQALQDKVVNKEEEGEKTIVPTGDIIIGKLLEDGFYIADPTFLGTKLIKIETPTPGKFYYDKITHTYYTFQGYNETGYNFKPVVLPNLTELTWQELKDLRDDSRLIPGSLYRITDYNCTTTQENTKSAGHQFDIVLLALSENKLAEEGWAMHHANDTYFANSNLPAWKVWYCLDNDKSRFAWASDKDAISCGDMFFERYPQGDTVHQGDNYYAWRNSHTNTIIYTEFLEPNVDDYTYDENFDQDSIITIYVKECTGVIYRLIDEFNNDIKYDFKNIQFKRRTTNGQYDDVNGTETWCYTLNVWYNNMCQDASIVGNTLLNDEGFISGVYDNIFGYATAYDFYIEGVSTFTFALGNNVVLSLTDGDGYYYGIYSNMFGDGFFNNTFGNRFSQNTFGSGCRANTLGDEFSLNTIGNDFKNNRISNNFHYNTIGNSFGYNIIENDFSFNMIGNAFQEKQISTVLSYANYGNNGVELATKDDLN